MTENCGISEPQPVELRNAIASCHKPVHYPTAQLLLYIAWLLVNNAGTRFLVIIGLGGAAAVKYSSTDLSL
jgi:hypothetical protein